MPLVTHEGLMAVGGLDVDLTFTPATYEKLWDAENNRPHNLFMLVKDPEGNLAYPPYILTRVNGDERRGLKIGGPGVLAELGTTGVGPTSDERDYLSGESILSNGDFALEDLYWRRPSEGSTWSVYGGQAINPGGSKKDDIWEYSLQLPEARPGNEYRATAHTVTGVGTLRTRITFGGRFNPPNLLPNPGFEEDSGAGTSWTTSAHIGVVSAGAHSGAYALRVTPIPKPELIDNGDFSAGAAGWTFGSEFAVISGGLIAYPNPQPQYISDPHLETLSGWTSSIGPVGHPMSDDIQIIADGTHARTGTGVMRVGPVTQHQVFTNAAFEGGFVNWFVSSTDAEPDPTWWSTEATEGNEGSACVRTIGWSTAGAGSGPLIKYLRADSVSGGGVEPYDVNPGESYRYEVYVKAAPGSEGQVYASIQMPHPTVPGHDTWLLTEEIEGTEHADMRWNVLSKEFTVPNNRFQVNALVEFHNHGLGYWYVDTATLTRTRGNRAQTNFDAPISVVSGTTYEISALIKSGDFWSGGNIRIGAVLTGPGVDPQTVGVDEGSTDYEWSRIATEFRPPEGYDTATPFVAGLDITGDSIWLDVFEVTKVENNMAVATHMPFAVIPGQRYQLSADVTSIGATRGEIAVGVTFSGAGQPDQDFEVTPSKLDDLKTKTVSAEVRPPDGYTVATPYVRSTDVMGGVFAIDRIRLTKLDNNSESVNSAVFSLTPERTYRWTQPVWFDTAVERGNVRLGIRCTRAGYDDETFYSSPMDIGEAGGTWQTLRFEFTPSSGYDVGSATVVATDTEGGFIYLDDGEIRDTDTSSVVFDYKVASPVAASPTFTAVAPAGTESVHFSLVAEGRSRTWTVAATSLVRVDKDPSTGDEIIVDILTHPITGEPLAIGPGVVDCPEVIPNDWRPIRYTARGLLDYYSTVVSSPPREYYVTATDPPLLNVAERTTLFGDRTDVIYVDAHIRDPDIHQMEDPDTDVIDRASEIRLIGTNRQNAGGGTTTIESTSQVPVDPEYDYLGRQRTRTKIVSMGTVDHQRYASAMTEDLALLEADPPITVTVALNEIDEATAAVLGLSPRPRPLVGDDVYLFKPTAGLIDPSRSMPVDGQEVFPVRLRLLDRERSHGPGYTVTMRRPDGTSFELEGIINGVEETRITAGSQIPGWKADPGGRAEGLQYYDDRTHQPK